MNSVSGRSTSGSGATIPKACSPNRIQTLPAHPRSLPMNTGARCTAVVALCVVPMLAGCADVETSDLIAPSASVLEDDLDTALRQYLASHAFTGRIASTLESRLGRRI